MRPYNVEIFDKNFNFRSAVLIDPAIFQYQEDRLTQVNNTLTIPNTKMTIREDASSGSADDGTVALSDYIRITTDNGTFDGVIKKLEKEDENLIITYNDFLCLFNHEVFTDPLALAYTPIESYIRDLLNDSFITNADTFQRIPGLSCSTKTYTFGTFDFMDASKDKIILNILNDLIYPAFKKYLVGVYISLDLDNKALQVDIGWKSTTILKTIEADLPNVIDKNVVIRGTSSELNKLVIVDDDGDTYPSYTYYLHTDYSYDTDGSSNRLLPVINDMELVNIETLAENSYWIEHEGALTATDLIEIDRPISDAEKGDINEGLSMYAPFIYSARITQNYNHYSTMSESYVSWILGQAPFYRTLGNWYYWYDCSGGNPYDDLQEKGEGYYYYTISYLTGSSNQGYDAITYKGTSGYERFIYDEIPGTSGWHTSDPIRGRLNASCDYHAVIKQNIKITLYITIRGNEGIPSVYQFNVTIWNGLTKDEYREAHDAYLKSSTYKNNILTYKNAHLSEILSNYAGSAFGTSKYKNLIELTMLADDPLIRPLPMSFGAHLNIIHKGVAYHSILTGKTYMKNGLAKLTFGMIRLELTKILNMKGV